MHAHYDDNVVQCRQHSKNNIYIFCSTWKMHSIVSFYARNSPSSILGLGSMLHVMCIRLTGHVCFHPHRAPLSPLFPFICTRITVAGLLISENHSQVSSGAFLHIPPIMPFFFSPCNEAVQLELRFSPGLSVAEHSKTRNCGSLILSW